MARRIIQKQRRQTATEDVVRGPARTRVEGTGINPFTIPTPKGKNPGPITRSVAWKPPATTAVDEEEMAAFGGNGGGRAIGDVMPTDGRNRRVSAAALEAAQRRMQGVRIEPDPDDNDEDEQEQGEPASDDSETDETPFETQLIEQTRMAPPIPLTPVKARAPHPSEQYDEPPVAVQMPAPKSGVKVSPNGDVITHPSGLYITKVTVACIDHLWDWIRTDGDHGKSFLGMPITTSLALHQYIQYIAKAEEQAHSAIRSIYWYGNGSGLNHLGFVMLSPILAQERTALMHIYLEKSMRGGLAKIVGPLVDMAEAYAPGMHLAVYSADDVWARLHKRLLTPLGFREQVMFIR